MLTSVPLQLCLFATATWIWNNWCTTSISWIQKHAIVNPTPPPSTESYICLDTQHACLTHWGRLTQTGRQFLDDIFKCIFLNENIQSMISLNIVPKGLINHIPALVQIMACCQPGDKSLYEPMLASLLTHIYVTRPQWIKLGLRNYTLPKTNELRRFCL